MLVRSCILVFWAVCCCTRMTSASDDDDRKASCTAPDCKCIFFLDYRLAECGESHATIPNGLDPISTQFYMSSKNLRSLSAKAFSSVGLVKLVSIRLDKCGIESVDKDAFFGLKELTNLYINVGNITSLHPETLQQTPELKEFHLRENPIEVLEDGLFTHTPNLTHVDFAGCRIKRIGDAVFSGVPRLRAITLHTNQLTHLNFSIIESIPGNTSLYLLENPWRCDCHLRQFHEWYIKKAYPYFLFPNCAEPVHLKDKRWDSVSSDQFTCEAEPRPRPVRPAGEITSTPVL